MSTSATDVSSSFASRLFLDASGLTTRVGLWKAGRWLAYRENAAPALEALFTGTNAVLAEAGLTWPEITGFIYVEGPGSVLGLRLAAMAIRTWQTDDAASNPDSPGRPVMSCGSLHLAAALALTGGTPPPFAIFTEARQGLWHILEATNGTTDFASLVTREVKLAELPRGTLFHIPARKAWIGAPPHAQPLPVMLRDHPEVLSLPNLLRTVETPVPFAGAPPEYRKWAGAKT